MCFCTPCLSCTLVVWVKGMWGAVSGSAMVCGTHCGCDVTDISFQTKSQSGGKFTKSRTGDEQQDCLHGLHEEAAIPNGQFSACPVMKQHTATS